MKKGAALAAALVLCAGTAYAYENSYAGYSVKDGKPFYKLESKKAYAYTEMSSRDVASEDAVQKTAANIVNYYTAEDMTQILDADFSTAYFDAEWDKLAVLERSGLSLKTVPTPLLDLDKYAAYDHNGNVTIVSQVLKEKLAQLTPVIKLQKIGKQKVITISYLYKQGCEMLINIDTTLLSANDRLYMLTTVNSDHELYAPKKDEKAEDTAVDTDEADDDIFADAEAEKRTLRQASRKQWKRLCRLKTCLQAACRGKLCSVLPSHITSCSRALGLSHRSTPPSSCALLIASMARPLSCQRTGSMARPALTLNRPPQCTLLLLVL